jgi:PAS domain S-box-containing protein
MAALFQRKTFMILALALSLAITLITLALDEGLRQRLGDRYWVIGLAIIGCILLVLAGYVWDRSLIDRLRQINETARRQGQMISAVEPGLLPPDTREESGNPGHDEIIGLARQIERMAQALQRVEASYRAVVEDQIDLICRYRADGTLTFVNGAMARFLGKKRQDLIGQRLPLLDLGYPKRDYQGHLPETAQFEVDLTNAEGMAGSFLWVHRAIKSNDGHTLEYQAVGHDITTRKDAEATLVRAKEAAESADRAKSEFLAVVSHEIRTPINSVINFAKLLRETSLTPDQREFVEMIHSSGTTLESLIADILDLSRIEAGKIEIEHEAFGLRDCVNEVAERFAPKARAAGLELDVRIDPGVPPVVNGDEHRLRQILSNLIGNAIKFTERGHVMLSLTCIRGDDIVGTNRRRLRLFFAVTDTGIGIPADRLNQLFRPFSQVDTTPGRRRGGTGLGLVISKRLCELMGGAISVESRAGEGSTFRFSLALDYDRGETSSVLSAAPRGPQLSPNPGVA